MMPMQSIAQRIPLDLSRFDGIVIVIIAGFLLATGLVIWRGDRVGVQIVQVRPGVDAANVSTRAEIRITFDQPLERGGETPLTVTPAISGAMRWQGNTLVFSPLEAFQSDTTYTVTLADDLRSEQGRVLQGESRWQFQTRHPQLLYMAPLANELDQLFLLDPTTDDITQLTEATRGVFSYELSPDASTIIYSQLREDSGADLWSLDLETGADAPLLTCTQAKCSEAVWMPDGSRVVYERREMLLPGEAPGPPRLWWLNLSNSDTVPVFEDRNIIAFGARWSMDSTWLSYVAPASQGVQVYNFETGESFLIPSRSGSLGIWSPHEASLIVPDIQALNEGFAVHLLQAIPGTGTLINISGDNQLVEDGQPTWSPDGTRIAFTRKPAGVSMGKQVWLMQADGSEAQHITTDPEIHHGLPVWSPDGRALVYQRFPLRELGAQPGLWLHDLTTGDIRELVSPGNRATWLP